MPRIQHAEEIARKWFPGLRDVTVMAVRSATLDEELREVLHRRLEQITVTWQGSDSRVSLTREETEWLHAALAAALQATDDFAPTPPAPDTEESHD